MSNITFFSDKFSFMFGIKKKKSTSSFFSMDDSGKIMGIGIAKPYQKNKSNNIKVNFLCFKQDETYGYFMVVYDSVLIMFKWILIFLILLFSLLSQKPKTKISNIF